MAPRRSACQLEDLCLQVVVSSIKTIVGSHCRSPKFKDNKMREDLKTVLEYIPTELHDKLAEVHLHTVVDVFGDEGYSEDSTAASDDSRRNTCFKSLLSKICMTAENDTPSNCSSDFFRGQTYFNRLMSVFDLLQIKKLVLENQPAYIERKFSDLFDNMTSLEVFSCKDSWISVGKPGFNFGKLLTAYPALSNLTSFTMRYYCTDKILSVICENCKALRMVDVGRYKSWPCRITDLSIQSLIKCRMLEHVNLHNTTVSADGFFKLLCKTKSKRLLKVEGLEMCLDKVLDKLADAVVPKFSKTGPEIDMGIELETLVSLTLRTFQLQELRCNNLNEEHLHLTVKHFPHLNEMFFNFWGPTLPRDFSALLALKKLKRVGFECLNCSPDDMCEILSTCPSVVSISVRNVNKSMITVWLNNISTLCPDIEKLVICGTEVSHLKNESSHLKSSPDTLLASNSFQKLIELDWYEPSLMNAKLVLKQAKNVQSIHFYRATDLSDEFFESVFKHNPLSQLKKLTINYTSNKCCKLSCDIMKRIIVSCEQLTDFLILLFFHPVIEDFTSSTRRLVKKKESFQQVRDFIVENNYGVNFEVKVMNRPLTAYRLM